LESFWVKKDSNWSRVLPKRLRFFWLGVPRAFVSRASSTCFFVKNFRSFSPYLFSLFLFLSSCFPFCSFQRSGEGDQRGRGRSFWWVGRIWEEANTGRSRPTPATATPERRFSEAQTVGIRFLGK
jgi:hypothetical protein